MSEEQTKELEQVIDMPRIEQYILELQKENEELKKMVNNSSITITKCPKCGEKFSINYCREVDNLKNILTEFEKWLENFNNLEILITPRVCLDKLQELKGVINNE